MNEHLKIFYLSIPRYNREHLEKRDEIIDKCGINQTIWYNWIQGKTNVPKPCKEIIAKVFEVSINQIFPK